MKVFALEFPLHKPGISFVQYLLFHGIQAPPPHWRPAPSLMGDAEYWPLVLIHNARRVPAIFAPDLMLVLSDSVAKQVAEVEHSDLRPVQFHRFVDAPIFPRGDESYRELPAYQQAVESAGGIETLLDRLPDASPELVAGVGNYFELIPTRLKDVTSHFPDTRPVRCARPYTIDKTNELLLSPTLVEEYPVTWWDQTILHERVYRLLEPHLDPAYAEVVEINL